MDETKNLNAKILLRLWGEVYTCNTISIQQKPFNDCIHMAVWFPQDPSGLPSLLSDAQGELNTGTVHTVKHMTQIQRRQPSLPEELQGFINLYRQESWEYRFKWILAWWDCEYRLRLEKWLQRGIKIWRHGLNTQDVALTAKLVHLNNKLHLVELLCHVKGEV